MARGGYRKGSGRKSLWKHSRTELIRVPNDFVEQVLAFARELDEEKFANEEKPSEAKETALVLDFEDTQSPIEQLSLSWEYFPISADGQAKPSFVEATNAVEEADVVVAQIPRPLLEKVLKLIEDYEIRENKKLEAAENLEKSRAPVEPCPHCGSMNVRKHGFYRYNGKNERMFRCYDCKKTTRRPNLEAF